MLLLGLFHKITSKDIFLSKVNQESSIISD